MRGVELRNKYLEFFKSKRHNIISGAKLILENDPTVLFYNLIFLYKIILEHK